MEKASCLAVFVALLLLSCGEKDTTKNQTINEDSLKMTLPIMIEEVPSSPDYKNAKLMLAAVNMAEKGDSVRMTFNFAVSNYELKIQTADAGKKQCNNSDKGQHIHFILDNKPYIALYEPKHEMSLAKNSEHYLMAFLSRSYHESVKTKGAAMVYHFKIDKKGKLVEMNDPTTPMIFYSRPKGDYIGKDVENVLFDYYLWNAELGNPVALKVEVDGKKKDTSFTTTEWKPLFLKNLAMGKNKIKLTLVDSTGKKIKGPETDVSREFNLAKEEPMK